MVYRALTLAIAALFAAALCGAEETQKLSESKGVAEAEKPEETPPVIVDCARGEEGGAACWLATPEGRPVFTTWTIYTLAGERVSALTTNKPFEFGRPVERSLILQIEAHLPDRPIRTRIFMPKVGLAEQYILPYESRVLWELLGRGSVPEGQESIDAYYEMLRFYGSDQVPSGR